MNVKAIDGFRLELGEGPGYDADTDTAWWFDIPNRHLFLHRLQEGITRRHELPVAASAMAVTKDGRQFLVAEGGLYLRDPGSGELSLHLPLEAGNRRTRSNDARVHPCGAFWLSTMGWGSEHGGGAWYHYFRGQMRRLWDGVTIPNAACFSPDGSQAYFTDTPTGVIMRVATDPATGLPRSEPEAFIGDLEGPPDGAVTDAAGNLWVALWGKGTVLGLSSDGRRIGSVGLPAANVTCSAFVGGDRMLVTTARYGMTDDERAASPDAGATFILAAPTIGRYDPPVAIA